MTTASLRPSVQDRGRDQADPFGGAPGRLPGRLGHPDYSPVPSPAVARALPADRLRALTARWYEEARGLGDLDTCRAVVQAHGEPGWDRTERLTRWRSGALQIRQYGAGAAHRGHLEVWLGGDVVCSTRPGAERIVPGRWIDEVRAAARGLDRGVGRESEHAASRVRAGQLRLDLGPEPDWRERGR